MVGRPPSPRQRRSSTAISSKAISLWSRQHRSTHLRLSRARGRTSNRVFVSSPGRIERFVLWTMLFTVAGGLACRLTSTCVKLVLSASSGIRSSTVRSMSTPTPNCSRCLSAATPDVSLARPLRPFRDFADKLVVVPMAHALVILALSADLRSQVVDNSGPELRTDVTSIFVFGIPIQHSFFWHNNTPHDFHTLARRTRLPGSAIRPWCCYSTRLWLSPFWPSDFSPIAPPTNCRAVSMHCTVAGAKPPVSSSRRDQQTAVLRSAVTHALGTSVSMWPLRHVIDPLFGVPVALGAIIVALSGYLVIARFFYAMLTAPMQKLETVPASLEVGCEATASAEL